MAIQTTRQMKSKASAYAKRTLETLPISTLESADVPAMKQLVRGPGVGWKLSERDLRRLVEEGAACGIFSSGARDQLLSMAALRTWGCRPYSGSEVHARWGWLSCVCTLPEARKKGLARRLVKALLQKVGNMPVGLYAGGGVPARLYKSLGFERCGSAKVFRGDWFPGSGHGKMLDFGVCLSTGAPRRVLPMMDILHKRIADVDCRTCGAYRIADLRAWCEPPGLCMTLPSGSYAFARPLHPNGMWLGPIVAQSAEEAELLLCSLLAECPAGPVEMQVPHCAPTTAAELVTKFGFKKLFTSNCMVSGQTVPPLDAGTGEHLVFLGSGAEYG